MSDTDFRGLSRQLAATSDPAVAKRLLFAAVREGRWLIREGDWNVNTHRIGTLRFLAYLGWKEAVHLMGSLPLAHTGFRAPYPTHTDVRRAGQGAYGEIGDHVAKEIAPTVLSAAAAAACMAVRHLMPEGFDANVALTLWGEAVVARREYLTTVRSRGGRLDWTGSPVSGREKSEEQEEHEALVERLRKKSDEFDRRLQNFSFRIRPNSFDGREGRTPPERAIYSARKAWGELLGSATVHESDSAKDLGEALFWATYALAWGCEPATVAPDYFSDAYRALPNAHWAKASRARGGWSDKHGARASVRCMRVAKKALREAMLNPALVAAATLVG